MKRSLIITIVTLLAVVTILNVCVLIFVVKDDRLEISYDESAIVSVYKLEREQDENGFVIEKDLKLWKTERVLPTRMLKLSENKESCEYYCKGSGDFVDDYGKNLYFFPHGDDVIVVREREKKNINFYLNGQNIYLMLIEEEKKEFNDSFTNTYEESFEIPKEFFEKVITRIYGNNFTKVELYTNPSFNGEPFAFQTMFHSSYYNEYIYYSLAFSLIEAPMCILK